MRCYCCCLHHIREEMFNWWWWWLSNENGWEKTNHHTRRPGASATCHRHKTMTTFNVHAIAQMRIDRFRSISPIRVRVRNVHPREREKEKRSSVKSDIEDKSQSIYLIHNGIQSNHFLGVDSNLFPIGSSIVSGRCHRWFCWTLFHDQTKELLFFVLSETIGQSAWKWCAWRVCLQIPLNWMKWSRWTKRGDQTYNTKSCHNFN